jgi:hypothetical protein
MDRCNLEISKKTIPMEFSGVYANTILKYLLKEWGEKLWTGFWLIQCRDRQCSVRVVQKNGKFWSS